jgi:hypothetical protein
MPLLHRLEDLVMNNFVAVSTGIFLCAIAGAAYYRIAYPVCQRPDVWGTYNTVSIFDHWIDPSLKWGDYCPNTKEWLIKNGQEVRR